jgi:hypothetical protein
MIMVFFTWILLMKCMTRALFLMRACNVVFALKNRGGCGAHLFRVHGIVNPVRRLFDSTQCCSCLREFHTFSKLRHIFFVYPDVDKNCSIVGILWGLQQEQDRLPTLPMQETLHDGILPPLRAEGPSLLPAPRDEVEYDITLYESVCLVWIDATTPDEGERVVRDCIRCRPISWHTCWPKMPEDFLSVSDFCTLMDQLSQIHAWDFLTVRDDCGPGHWHQHLSILEEWCEAEVSTEQTALKSHGQQSGASLWQCFQRRGLSMLTGELNNI